MKDLKWSGCWELRLNRYICRWMAVWVQRQKKFIGCIAGYSGGGAFQLEKFSICDEDIKTSDLSGFSESLTGEEISISEDCQDAVLAMHDEGLWSDNDTLVLVPNKAQEMNEEGELLIGGDALPDGLLPLFEKIGLISRPA